MHFLLFNLLLAIGPLVHSRPSRGIQFDDVIYTPEQLQFFEGHKASRTALSWSKYYWKNSTLVYSFGIGLNAKDRALIKKAMKKISSQTCVKFRKTYNYLEPQVVIRRLHETCYAEVGYQGKLQELNLGFKCLNSKVIQHELLHALGLHHTQCHPDRDQYVQIKFENIEPSLKYNFEKLKDVTNFNLGYDYASIMHYGPFAFSRNGNPTIISLKDNVNIGQATRLSPKDVATLNRMYC